MIPVGEGQALVLGDAPSMTCYLPEHHAFVRWIAADTTIDWREVGTWVTDGSAVLMSASYAGSELGSLGTSDDQPAHVPAPVPAGQWSVQVTYDDRAPRTWAVIVRLDPVAALSAAPRSHHPAEATWRMRGPQVGHREPPEST